MKYTLEEAEDIFVFEERIDKKLMDEELTRSLWPNVVTIEELEGLSDFDIWDKFSGLVDIKKFKKIMFWVNAFRRNDIACYNHYISQLDRIFPTEYIINDLVKRGEFEMLKAIGVSDTLVRDREFDWKYPWAKGDIKSVPIWNLKVNPFILIALSKTRFKTVGDLLDKNQKLQNHPKISKAAFENINAALKEFVDYYQVKEYIPYDKNSYDKDVILEVICEGMDRRRFRAYLKSLGLLPSTISTIVNYKFPRKKDDIDILEDIAIFEGL